MIFNYGNDINEHSSIQILNLIQTICVEDIKYYDYNSISSGIVAGYKYEQYACI